MQAALHHVAVALRRAPSVVVCAHVRPDGDAIGSVLGLTLALRELGVPAVPTLADDREPPSTYRWLPGAGLFVGANDLEPPSVFVALDTPVIDRLGVASRLAESADKVIVIDHHPDAREYGDVHALDPAASATGQLVWWLLDALDFVPTPEIALCCYTALVTDTGRFSFQNTTSRALRDAADMIDAGVDPAEVARIVYQSRTREAIALDGIALSRLECPNGGRVAYTYVTDEDFETTGAKPEEAEHLPEVVRSVEGAEVAVLLRQKGTEVRGNLRSKGSFDVGAVARRFGGGGHAPAAGFTVEDSTVDAVIAEILPLLPGGSERQ